MSQQDDDFTVTGDELDRCLDRAERAEAENRRLRAALDSIRLHAEGQVSQYARARESIVSIAISALTPPRITPPRASEGPHGGGVGE